MRRHVSPIEWKNVILYGEIKIDPAKLKMRDPLACISTRIWSVPRKEYKRVNGPFTLYMTAIGDNKLPFGNFPRLLMAWVSTEAVRTQSRVLILGPSLAKFMKTLGVYSSGGGREQIKLRNQMKRLFNAHIQLLYEDQHGEATVNAVIARRTEFWWNERKPDQPSLWGQQDRNSARTSSTRSSTIRCRST